MRIFHVVTQQQKASGVALFVSELTSELRALGHDVSVVNDFHSLQSDGQRASVDIIHIHGLWAPMLYRAAKWARRNRIPVVWSPHGMLQKWALKNKCWKKLVGLALYQWRALRSAALLHATAQSEVLDARRLWLQNKVVVVPLGVRTSGAVATMDGEKRTLLFVSRVQRKKGLPNLVDAWSQLPVDVRAGWRVRIVGPDEEGHMDELKTRCVKCGVGGDFQFVGPKYDDELESEYLNADLFVLPTHSENFGSVVIEALARGVPVITTKEAPWVELEEHECGWWIEDSVAALCGALQMAMALPREDLRMMGSRGLSLVKGRYTWESVARTMVNAYKEVLDGSQIV